MNQNRVICTVHHDLDNATDGLCGRVNIGDFVGNDVDLMMVYAMVFKEYSILFQNIAGNQGTVYC